MGVRESKQPTVRRDSLCERDKNRYLPQGELGACPAERRNLRNPSPSLCTIYTKGEVVAYVRGAKETRRTGSH